jgi:hypothetical protein
MSLLFEHIGFTLPFPNEKLSLIFRGKSDPLSGSVDGDRVDFVL